MDTESRLANLESDRTILNRIASEQLLRLRDIEHNETMVMGIVTSQNSDIKEMKTDIASIKEHLARMERHFDERLDALMAMVNKLQSPQG